MSWLKRSASTAPDVGYPIGPTPRGWARPADRPERVNGEARVAIITMVRDEGEMLALWVRHHAALVGLSSLVVLDDSSSDGSTEGLGCTVHRLPPLPGKGFTAVKDRLMSGFATGLLQAYDYAVYLDADEFLVVDPEVGSLGDLLAARDYPEVLGVVGLNVVHLPDEDPLDLARPILEQRRAAVFAPVMCKPSMKRIPAPWTQGSHGIRVPYAVEPALFMLHLKFADRDRLAAVSQRRYDLTQSDGRATKSNWSAEPDQMVATLDAAVGDLADESGTITLTDFDPTLAELDSLIGEFEGSFRTPRVGQVDSLRARPVQAIPTRLRGLL